MRNFLLKKALSTGCMDFCEDDFLLYEDIKKGQKKKFDDDERNFSENVKKKKRVRLQKIMWWEQED